MIRVKEALRYQGLNNQESKRHAGNRTNRNEVISERRCAVNRVNST